MTPAWITDIFAATALAVAALSLARIAAARPRRREAAATGTDIAQALMAIAMAGTLASSLRTLPNGAWAGVFAMLTAWFTYRVVQNARTSGARTMAGLPDAPQVAHSTAMLYMFLALAAPAAGGARAGGPATLALNHATLAFGFALVLAGYSVWDLDQLSGARYSLARTGTGAMLAVPAQPGSPARAGASSAETALSGSLAARMTIGCRVALGVTMAFMLLIMI